MYSKLLAVVFLGALVRAEASKLGVRIPSIPGGGVEARSLFGRETAHIPCADLGYEDCGDVCMKAGNSCCEWGGSCKPGYFCDVPTAGESGQPGCCPDGLDCNRGGGPGGTETITFTNFPPAHVSSKFSTSIHETTSTPPATSVPAPGSTSIAVSVPSIVVSTYTTSVPSSVVSTSTEISSASMPIATTGAPTNVTATSTPDLPTQVPGSGASGVSVQAGFVGVMVMIAGLFAL